MLERIKAGKGRLKDLDLLLEIGDSIGIIPGTTICGLADGAAWPIKNAIRKFRGEFEDYIKRTNPGGYAVPSRAGLVQLGALKNEPLMNTMYTWTECNSERDVHLRSSVTTRSS